MSGFRGDRGRGGRGGGRGASPGGRGSPDTFRGRGGPPGDRGGRGGFDRGRGGPGGGGPPRGRGGGGFAPREQGGIFAPGGPSDIDARLVDNTQDAIVASLKSLSLQDKDLPVRPDFGKVGTPIKLRANFFPVKVPKAPLYEYDVTITPAAGTAARRVKRRIFQLAEQTPDWTRKGLKGLVAHDHASKLIAAKELPQPLVVKVPWYDEDEEGPKRDGKEYTLEIKFIQTLNMQNLLNYLDGQPQYRGYDIMPVISALNLILAAHPNRTSAGGGVLVGRNRFFFKSAAMPVSLGGGLEAWKGFYSSVRPAHKQLMVNVNVCTTAFYVPQNLARAMYDFRQASFGARASGFIRGVRIKTVHLGYRKSVKGMSKLTAKTHKFDTPEFGKVTVEQYFKKKYNITLREPDLPLIDVGGQKANLLPAEVCEILPNQAFKGKLTDEHTANMITIACKPPNVNAAMIVGSGLHELGFKSSADPLGAFGVSIGTQMTIVPGRILPRPGVKYGQGAPSVDDRASWNLRNVKFAVGGKLDNWAVLVIKDGNNRDEFAGPQDPELHQVITGFAGMCRTSGMQVGRADPKFAAVMLPPKGQDGPTRPAAINAIRTALMEISPKPTLIMMILSNGDKHIYSGIKHLCDSYLDVPTVCVHSSKIRKEKGQPQYFANVALKVNMKMGGVNHLLDPASMAWLKKAPTMLVGMDVTHPGPGSVKGTPSIAAVVASVDGNYGQYPASLDIQESKKEMITNLASMMQDRIKLFKEKNKGVLPQRILVYRDGVSEGQFGIVVEEELFSIKAAFKKFDSPQKAYKPALTIVICGKRHHTRFYPTEANAAAGDGNPRPGTVVDRGVTAIYDFDFFLQAHGGLQGTTRPTHYYVVHDEIGFKADELQGLTNQVSYMFARATKAVSLVSPAYYADLACERGRCYLHKLLQGGLPGDGTSQSPSEDAVRRDAESQWHGGIGQRLKDTMFYL